MSDPPSLQFDRPLADEKPKPYVAYSIYRDLGANRSPSKAWRKYRTLQGLPPDSPISGGFKSWRTKYRWDERCRLRDEDILYRAMLRAAEADRVRYQVELQNFSDRAALLGDKSLELAAMLFEKLELAIERIDPEELSVRQISALGRLASVLASEGVNQLGLGLDVEEVLGRVESGKGLFDED